MTWYKHLLKPSVLITALLVLLVVILGIVSYNQPNVNDNFYDIMGSSIKVLSGALAGAIAGEKYTDPGDKK